MEGAPYTSQTVLDLRRNAGGRTVRTALRDAFTEFVAGVQSDFRQLHFRRLSRERKGSFHTNIPPRTLFA
jgi:hypothetical protein